jgi:polysaccharide biosynthesis protein PslH
MHRLPLPRMRRPRILCVSDVIPWPARDGYRIRLSHVLHALAQTGTVDLFAAGRGAAATAAAEIPDDLPLRRIKVSSAPAAPLTAPLLARTLAGPLPRRVLWRTWLSARRELRAWAEPAYDLVWYSHADALAGLGPVAAAASVLDIDNLEDMRLRSLRAAHLRGLRSALTHPGRSADLATEARYRVAGSIATFDARRWTRLQRRLADQVDAVLVCSDLDQRRLGAPNAVVIPNGYDEPATHANGSSGRNVMSMVGLFHYGPNSDGARFFVDEVLPRVRTRIPDAGVRFIGRHDGHLGDLADRDGVVVTGEVESVAGALGGTRVVVVPLRAGSGTRLKVLEAFASRMPVVSTTLGCEGLDVVPGRHLLIADTAEGFADACTALLSDDSLHEQVSAEGFALFQSQYRWQDIGQRIGELVQSLVQHGVGTFSGV